MNTRLAELRNVIRRVAKQIGQEPCARDTVWLTLQDIDQEFGPIEANKAVRDFKLKRHGFEETE